MDYQQALDHLWKVGQGGKSKSSGERVAAGIILGLYQGDGVIYSDLTTMDGSTN